MKVILAVIVLFSSVCLNTNLRAQAIQHCDSVIMNDGTVKLLNVQEITRNKLIYFLCCENCGVPRELKTKDVDTVIYNTQKAISDQLPTDENSLSYIASNSYAKEDIKRYSFYIEGTLPFGYWDVASYGDFGFSTVGVGINVGNKWYLSKGERFRTGVIVNYARAEFTINVWYLDPLHIGLANAWQRRNGSVVEFNLYGGPRLNYDNIKWVGFGISPELKFRVKGTLVGIAYDYGREVHSLSFTEHSKTNSHMLRFSVGFYK